MTEQRKATRGATRLNELVACATSRSYKPIMNVRQQEKENSKKKKKKQQISQWRTLLQFNSIHKSKGDNNSQYQPQTYHNNARISTTAAVQLSTVI